MAEMSVGKIIDSYKKAVIKLAKDKKPGHKAIVVYGGYMGKSYHTLNALKEVGFEECYSQTLLVYNKARKDWVYNTISEARKGNPIIMFDSCIYPYKTWLGKVPEFKELIKTIPEGKFGFTLKKPYKYYIDTKKYEIIPEGFFEIKANLIFLVGYTTPKEMIDIMPSFNFNFEGKQLLDYLRENVDTLFTDFDNLTHEIRLETIDILSMAYDNNVYETLDFKWIIDAFSARQIFEEKRTKNDNTEDFYKKYGRKLGAIKHKQIS